jgi:ankyrin repeat protein
VRGAGHIEFPRNADEEELNRLVAANDLRALSSFIENRPAILTDHLINWGEGILSGVANRGNRPALELLLRHGACVPDVTKWGRAYYFKHYFIAELLLERGMNPNHMNWHRTTLLHEIVWEGDVRKARLLLDYRADIDGVDEEFRSTPLGIAARWGRMEMLRLLLDRGADPNRSAAKWATPLAWA